MIDVNALEDEFKKNWYKTQMMEPSVADAIVWAVERQNAIAVKWMLEHTSNDAPIDMNSDGQPYAESFIKAQHVKLELAEDLKAALEYTAATKIETEDENDKG